MPDILTPRQFITKLTEYVTSRHDDQTDELAQLMDRKPESVTGKTAFRIAGRRMAYKEILDWIADEGKKVRL